MDAPINSNGTSIELENEIRRLERELQAKNEQVKALLGKLGQAEKLALLGTLGAGFAHELNNPLTVIGAESDEIIDAIEGGYHTPEMTMLSAQKIKHCVDRMRYYVDHLRQYARKDETTPWQQIHINDIIHNAILMLKPRLKQGGVDVRVSLADDLPRIWGHANKLESVFQNLLANSIDAFKPLSRHDNEDHLITIKTNLDGDSGVIANFRDNGCGMTKEVQESIFDPFFTTKEIGEGTGLGLAIVNSYLREHRALLEVESLEDVGTTFTIKFPLERRGLASEDLN